MKKRPSILVIAGHDPTGGAGIQADIETINDLGGHALSLITAMTQQDSASLYSFQATDADYLYRQYTTLAEDFDIKCIKIGMLASVDNAAAVAGIIDDQPGIPVVVDPVLAAGGGASTSSESLLTTLKKLVLPRTTLLTPNSPEARRLAGMDSLDQCARAILNMGCKHILITGTHEDSDSVVNRLYSENASLLTLTTPRLTSSYHGSGCTLASAAAFYISSNYSLTDAVRLAVDYTVNSLESADNPGNHQAFPVRNQRISRSE